MSALNKVTIALPYYENKTMLQLQLATWQAYPEELKKRIKIILVDDGSQEFPARDVIGKTDLPLQLFRVKEDIPWNQHGARNLAMKQLGKEWAFLTDMDLVLTTDNLAKMLELPVFSTQHYTFERLKMPDKEAYKYHPNTFLVHSGIYWKINGYDTHYCGTYGGDGPFKRDLEKITARMHVTNISLNYYPRGYIKDSGTNNYERQGPYKEEYRRRLAVRGSNQHWDPVPFAWEEVPLEGMNWKY